MIANNNSTFFPESFAPVSFNTIDPHFIHINDQINHKDNANRMTNKYIGKNWKIVDDIQRAVLKLYIDDKKLTGFCATGVFSIKKANIGQWVA